MQKNKKRAFTLIELMLVVIIIGILGAMVVPRLAGKAERARKTAAKVDIQSNIPAGLDAFEMDIGRYPQELKELVEKPAGVENWNGPYLKKLPKDPWGREYNYRAPGEHNNDYDLYSSGKDGVAGNEDDIVNWE